MSNKISIKNKKAYYDYEIIDEFVAGIQLTGTEIKSLRMGKASMLDSFCYLFNDEVWVKGISIAEYSYGTHNNHDPDQHRKLLLKKKEIRTLDRKVKEKGLTIVSLHLFINNKGLAKLKIGLAKGKKEYDKRESIKTKDVNREMDRARKSQNSY